MSEIKPLHEVLEQLAGDLPECLHTSVIDANTGLALLSISEIEARDAEAADAFHADLYRRGGDTAAELSGGRPREFVLRSQEATFVSTPVATTGYIWLVVTGPDTTVGFIQAMMRKHLARIEQGVLDLTDAAG